MANNKLIQKLRSIHQRLRTHFGHKDKKVSDRDTETLGPRTRVHRNKRNHKVQFFTDAEELFVQHPRVFFERYGNKQQHKAANPTIIRVRVKKLRKVPGK